MYFGPSLPLKRPRFLLACVDFYRRVFAWCWVDRLCINKKVFRHSPRPLGPKRKTKNKQKKNETKKQPLSVLATADPSWVCNEAGGAISGGEKTKTQPQYEQLAIS